MPVLIVLAYRPAGEPGGGLGVERLPSFSEIALDELGADDAAELIRSKLDQVRTTSGEIGASESEAGEALVALVTERSGGNPFYIEELITYISSHGVDPGDAAAVRALELPESLHSLVLSRIDTVGEEPRRTLKVASVVGRVFEAPVLPGAYPELGDLDTVIEQLDTLRAADLVNLDREADQAYLFKHVATQEVAYESLPFGVRAMLHGRVGSYIERSDPDAIERHLDLLAHHFWNSDDEERKRVIPGPRRRRRPCLVRERRGHRLPEPPRPAARRGRSARTRCSSWPRSTSSSGNWAVAETVARGRPGPRDATSATGPRRAGARRPSPRSPASRAASTTPRLAWTRRRPRSRPSGPDDGTGQVLHLAGTVAAQRGDYDTAQARYEESLAIRERLDDKASMGGLYSNLGIIAEYRGDYAAARAPSTSRRWPSGPRSAIAGRSACPRTTSG